MKLSKIIKLILFGAFAWLALAVFFPKKYNLPPLEKRGSTQFWELPTGSKIGYTMLPAAANVAKKPSPILFLHGGPGGKIDDGTILRASSLCEDGFDVYLYDQIGSGQSARLKNISEYSADRHERDLAAIIEKIGAKKVILIGQSWGAILASMFIADHPEKVEKVIFTCPGPIQPRRDELAEVRPPDSLDLHDPVFSNAQANRKMATLRSRFAAFLAKNWGCKLGSDEEMDGFASNLSAETARSVVCDPAKAMTKPLPGSGFYVQTMTMKSLENLTDPRPKLQVFQAPVLVMKGQYDNQKWGFTHEHLDVFPKSRLVVVPKAGHSIGLEQPEILLKTMRAFLAEP